MLTMLTSSMIVAYLFRMKYVEGSAKLENNGFANADNGGAQLSDAIVDAKDGGVLIGYNGLDGKIQAVTNMHSM